MNLQKFIEQIEKLNGKPNELHDFVMQNMDALNDAHVLLQELSKIMKKYACQPKPKTCKGNYCEYRKDN